MILIWDNGESYSAWSVSFIEVPAAMADAAVEILGMQDVNGHEVGRAESIEWRTDKPSRLSDAFSPNRFLPSPYDDDSYYSRGERERLERRWAILKRTPGLAAELVAGWAPLFEREDWGDTRDRFLATARERGIDLK